LIKRYFPYIVGRWEKVSEEPIYRKAETEDAVHVRELIYETIDTIFPTCYTQAGMDYFKKYNSTDRIIKNIQNGYCYCAILAQDQKFIGTGTLFGSIIKGMYVKPEYQKNGCGRRIIKELERKAKENKIEKIELNASPVSKEFYERLGYKHLAQVKINNNGQYTICYNMFKEM
jgi:N-acetylglutamate synthase-like GNAT family acetyltransferase